MKHCDFVGLTYCRHAVLCARFGAWHLVCAVTTVIHGVFPDWAWAKQAGDSAAKRLAGMPWNSV